MKKGFTLIELIMVITLLGILATIAVPVISGVINDSKEKAYEKQVSVIISAAKEYVTDPNRSGNFDTLSNSQYCYIKIIFK